MKAWPAGGSALTKEELYRFDGTPLFPERRAYTASYSLSPAEADLYQAVTTYVREEMNRADRTGDDKRRMNVGFALQILQRRLASSPAAIHRSLERRRKRMEERLREDKLMRQGGSVPLARPPALPAYDPDDIDEVPGAEAEAAEEQILDQATAAQTLAELEAEIAILKDLEGRALRLKLSGQDAPAYMTLYPSPDGMMHDECMVGIGGSPAHWYPADRDVPVDAVLHATVYERLALPSVRNYTSYAKYRPAPLRNHRKAKAPRRLPVGPRSRAAAGHVRGRGRTPGSAAPRQQLSHG